MTRRAAERRLATIGLARRHATQVLQAGLAGRPEITTSALLYDADAVDALVARAPLTVAEVLDTCPQGLVVARRTTSCLDDLVDGWDFGEVIGSWINLRAAEHGHVPLVTTRVGDDPSRPKSTLTLRPATGWVEAMSGRRLARGPGRPWSLVGFDALPSEDRHVGG
ncbi:hypothetical protein SAMN05421872_111138 [Nocardioides lianchengensis]|uniref:Uncharacterized protein n=2 Tax=Nocardioides lianchengensis TaxID=1045774 RepID=A0A1G6Y126_9ACTN|nr:hypothetical protein SAMN05421872_111138 [Nocardioides lianchengensis]